MNTIRTALRQRKRLTAHYTPMGVGAAGVRTLEPHVLGYSAKNVPLLRAWVQNGASYSNRTNSQSYKARWRLFRVNNLADVQLTNKTFKVRPRYNYEQDAAIPRVTARIERPPRTRNRP
jgi:hypothetical protein